MTQTITEMFCERCGKRHDFERARPSGGARLRGFSRVLRTYVLNQSPTFNDAMNDEWAHLAEDGDLQQYTAIRAAFSLCLECRGYVCHDCWNPVEGRCQTCAPLAAADAQPPVAPAPVVAGGGAVLISPERAAAFAPADADADADAPDAAATEAQVTVAEGVTEPPSAAALVEPRGAEAEEVAPVEDAAPIEAEAPIGAVPEVVAPAIAEIVEEVAAADVAERIPAAEPSPVPAAASESAAIATGEAVGAGTVEAAAITAVVPVEAPGEGEGADLVTGAAIDDDVMAAAVAAGLIEGAAPSVEPVSVAAAAPPEEPSTDATVGEPAAAAVPEPMSVAAVPEPEAPPIPEAAASEPPAPVPTPPAIARVPVAATARGGHRAGTAAPRPAGAVRCSHCGLQVPVVARFCRRCGARQEAIPA
jgi:hypothetical protein